MPKGKLVSGKKSKLAAKIRKAIGATENETVLVTTPQFKRTKDMPPVKKPPKDWDKLRNMTKAQLKALGCGSWDGRLMLFPKEWYNSIPAGYEIEDINGSTEEFVPGETDDDIRFGCLAYGVLASDGVEVVEANASCVPATTERGRN